MNMAGQYWWTLDIGGFQATANYSGDLTNPEYQELYVRWFQWYVPLYRVQSWFDVYADYIL